MKLPASPGRHSERSSPGCITPVKRLKSYWRTSMKTPRELILQRHQSAEPKLNAIRGEVLAACARATAAQPSQQPEPLFSLTFVAMKFWQESIRPWRRIWAGMAAIWLVLTAFNLATHDTPNKAQPQTSLADPA